MANRRRPKRHLPWGTGLPVSRAACGLTNPQSWSFDPAEVTCVACSKTLKMADAEVAQRTNPDRRNSNNQTV